MDHLAVFDKHLAAASSSRGTLLNRFAGRFYTPELVGRHLATDWVQNDKAWLRLADRVVIAEPFCGDGRLIRWAIEAACSRYPNLTRWEAHIWEIDRKALDCAATGLAELESRFGIQLSLYPIC